MDRTDGSDPLVACVTCNLLEESKKPKLALVEAGQVRRCNTDDDCTLHKGRRARFETGDYLCTRLNADFMGVPAGDGLCARPERCLITSAPGCNEHTLHPGTKFESTIGVVAGPLASGDRDFTPALPETASETDTQGVECQMMGRAR